MKISTIDLAGICLKNVILSKAKDLDIENKKPFGRAKRSLRVAWYF